MNRLLYWSGVALFVASAVVWILAAMFGWLDSVEFVSHISMAALVLSALAQMGAARAAMEAKQQT